MRKLLLLALVAAACAISAAAQSQSTTGNIEGRVVDPNGAVVPGVAVKATNQDTGFAKTTTSDADGNYIIVLLPPGSYKVEIGATKGFAAADYHNVQVTVGAKTALEVILKAGGSVNVVDVNAEGGGVELTRTSISSTVDETRVINLPTNGRNFLDFATITPGVIRDPTRAGDLAVGGQKGTLNSIQVDGASSDNTFFGQSTGRTGSGRAPSEFSVDTVKEFQVNQNGFSAEFGRAAGAVINVVTKSGTNKLHGSAFEYFRDASLNARSPILVAAGRVRPPGRIHQFGGTAGGPIKQDKAFFFVAYEGQRSNLPNPVVLNSLSQAPPAVQTLLTPLIASYNINRQQDTLLGKVDLNLNERNQVWFRFNYQNFRGTNLENSGTLSAMEHTGNSNVRTMTLTSQWTHTLSSNWFNEFRFQYSRDREPGLANTNSPEVALTSGTTISETFNFGRNNFSPRETTIKRYQFIDNQTYLRGKHTFKYGVDLMFDRIFNFFPGLFGGSYTFTSYAAFAANTPSRYRQSFAGAGTNGATTFPNNSEYGFFFQDDWRATAKLTINAGVRYDYQSIAQPPIQNPNAALLAAGFNTGFRPSDKNNFAPRLGVSYAINDKSVIRGGVGVYFGRTPAILTGTAHSQNGIQVIALDINCTTTPLLCPVYPAVFPSVPTGATLAPINLYLFSPTYAQPYTIQGRFQYEVEVLKNTIFSVQYSLYKGRSITRTRNANLTAPVATTYQEFTAGGVATGNSFVVQRFAGAGYAGPRVAGFTRISLFESSARSLYQGVTLEFNRRFSNHWQFNNSFTFSNAKDDKPDQTSVVPGGGDDAKIAENQFSLAGEYARSDLDIRQRFISSTVYDTGRFKSDNKAVRFLLSDYIFTGIFTAQSGIAYSALVSGDPNADGITSTDRVPGTGRNQFSTKPSWIVDMRVGRSFRFKERAKLTFFVEGYNIFNHPNVSAVNNTQYAANNTTGRFTATTNFGSARTFISGSPSFTFNSSYNREGQLGIRLDF